MQGTSARHALSAPVWVMSIRLVESSEEVIPVQSRCGKCEMRMADLTDVLAKALLSTESQPVTRRSENPKAGRLGSD